MNFPQELGEVFKFLVQIQTRTHSGQTFRIKRITVIPTILIEFRDKDGWKDDSIALQFKNGEMVAYGGKPLEMTRLK